MYMHSDGILVAQAAGGLDVILLGGLEVLAMRENDGSTYVSAWEARPPFSIFGCSQLKCDQFSKIKFQIFQN